MLINFRNAVVTKSSTISVILYTVFVVLDILFTLNVLIPKNHTFF
jgi:hypothetical protein